LFAALVWTEEGLIHILAVSQVAVLEQELKNAVSKKLVLDWFSDLGSVASVD
jgi:hypothetical protein